MAKKLITTESLKSMAEPAIGSVGRMAEKPEERTRLFAEIPTDLYRKIRIKSINEKRSLRDVVTEGLEYFVAHEEKKASN